MTEEIKLFYPNKYDKTVTLIHKAYKHLQYISSRDVSVEIKVFNDVNNKENKKEIDKILKEKYKDILNDIKRYNQNPLFVLEKDCYFKKVINQNDINHYHYIEDYYGDYYEEEEYIVKRNIVIYEYARNDFFKKMINYDKKINQYIEEEENKKNNLFSFFSKNKSVLLMNEKKEEIDSYLNERYYKWFESQFIQFHIPIHLLDELKKTTLISLKFDLIKSIMLLDNLVEKFEKFNIIGEKMSGLDYTQLINYSKSDFVDYINKQIKEMNDYSSTNVLSENILSEEDILNFEKIKKNIFS